MSGKDSLQHRPQTRESAAASPRWVPFAYGFRPFFLAALLYAAIGIAAWLWVRATGAMPLAALPPALWHGHEMLFRFIGAAIAGFLLTAVPSWTGSRGFAGAPLVALCSLWLLGRIGFGFAARIPVTVLAWSELLFLPALAILIAPPLVRARNRNTPLLGVLLSLWLVDAVFLRALALQDLALASKTLLVGVDIVLVLITVIGGRIVPAFTANALRRRGIDARVRSYPALDAAVAISMIGIVALDATMPGERWSGILAGVAACLHLVRLAGWQGHRSLGEPIVWVLHASYLWLPIGLALKAAFLLQDAHWASQWLHALTVGVAASMIVAVITRASLGHTGRPLTVSSRVAVAYGLLCAAALLRVLVGGSPVGREWMIRLSGGLWLTGFLIVLVAYLPVLLRPRVDGKPG